MSTSYDKLVSLEFPEVHDNYTERDTMLYALTLGMGQNPTSPEHLRQVYEQDLCAVPTMCVTLAHPGFWPRDLNTGLNYAHIVHGAQQLRMHRELPPSGSVIGKSRIRDVIDKGKDKGALVYFERKLVDTKDKTPICTMEQTLFCRGDGGMGGSQNQPPMLPGIPERTPDFVVSEQTSPQTALLYRLNGDMNPLHADPQIAQNAGFEKPILQGLATYGFAAQALIRTLCKGDPRRLIALDVRFTAPVYPGETLMTKIWKTAEGNAAVQVSVPARETIVIDNGKAEFT